MDTQKCKHCGKPLSEENLDCSMRKFSEQKEECKHKWKEIIICEICGIGKKVDSFDLEKFSKEFDAAHPELSEWREEEASKRWC